MTHTAILTVHLPNDLIMPLDRLAKEQLRSRSSLIAMFIRDGLRRTVVMAESPDDAEVHRG